MTSYRSVFFAAAFVLLAPDAIAQTRPDFSGRWVDQSAAAPAGAARGRGAGAQAAGRATNAGAAVASGTGAAAATAGAATAADAAGTARGGGGAQPQGRGRAGGRGGLGSGWGSDITITQNANRLSLQYVFFSSGDMQPPIIYHFALDGTATTNKLLLGWGVEERVSRTRWDGEKLIITTTYSYPHPETGRPTNTEFTQALTLENPTTLMVESTWPGVAGGAPTVTRTTYTKM